MTDWALILGASSGFGGATARACARAGMHVIGVHLDRKATIPDAEAVQADIKATGREALFFNMSATGTSEDPSGKKDRNGQPLQVPNYTIILDAVQNRWNQLGGAHRVKVLLHSLAFGTLKPYFAPEAKDALTQPNIEMTLDVMANSLVYWVQDSVKRNMLQKGSRIFAMTSAGGHRVWPTYGAVSAAKAALESHMRQIALELCKQGITANTIRAGVTDTPALRKIPGHEQMIENAMKINPGGRLTTVEDVAKTIIVLAHEDLGWMTGNIIGVDGGEDNSG